MTMIPFTPDKPAASQSRDSATVRNDLNALFRGDFSPLRARAQSTPNMTVQVAGTDVESFWREVWIGVDLPLNYAGGNSPALTAPTVNPRISLLTIDSSGTLAWTHGSEAASPTPPNCPTGKIPICWIYCKTTMVKIVNYEDAGANPNEGYIYRDVRPFLNLGGSVIAATNFMSFDKIFGGGGSDGDAVISSNTTLSDSGIGVKVMRYNNLTINTGIYLTAHANDKVLVLLIKGTLTLNGTIKMDGRGGAGASGQGDGVNGGGKAGAFGGGGGGATTGGGGGGNGQDGDYNGGCGGGGRYGVVSSGTAIDPQPWYNGGPDTGRGGKSNPATAGVSYMTDPLISPLIFEIMRRLYGGGGGSGSAVGGGLGGAGGGVLWIEANEIIWGGSGLFSSCGIAGGTVGGGQWGGGGGGGGSVQIVYKTKTGASAINRSGGAAGGGGAGPGAAGAGGIAGEFQVQ